MGIAQNILDIKNQLPERVQLVAVSKTKPESALLEAYQSGQRIFGENRVQELVRKHSQLPSDIEWHFIGHLQTNKVKQIVPFVKLIHAVDSLRLLQSIDKEARQAGRIVDVLLEFHIADEETKYGLSLDQAVELLSLPETSSLHHVRIRGVMGMATFTDDTVKVREEFRSLHKIFTALKERFFRDDNAFSEISMGMSDDFQIAIEEGSTMVRIGSHIFGSRQSV